MMIFNGKLLGLGCQFLLCETIEYNAPFLTRAYLKKIMQVVWVLTYDPVNPLILIWAVKNDVPCRIY